VLDEVMAALKYGLVEEKALRELLERPLEGVELVLTGRSAPEWMLKRADYITEMKKLRHPYDRGVAAREGIEY
jgi:cob(I)alamin adenosyltransferase